VSDGKKFWVVVGLGFLFSFLLGVAFEVMR
jgi:hypothetical protein